MVKRIPEVPGASLADIAFMLLIFFLVTTTMDIDSGLRRVLPPMPLDVPENTEKKERNVFVVLVDQNNRLMVEGELMENVGDLRSKAKEFLENPDNASNLPEKETKIIPYFWRIFNFAQSNNFIMERCRYPVWNLYCRSKRISRGN